MPKPVAMTESAARQTADAVRWVQRNRAAIERTIGRGQAKTFSEWPTRIIRVKLTEPLTAGGQAEGYRAEWDATAKDYIATGDRVTVHSTANAESPADALIYAWHGLDVDRWEIVAASPGAGAKGTMLQSMNAYRDTQPTIKSRDFNWANPIWLHWVRATGDPAEIGVNAVIPTNANNPPLTFTAAGYYRLQLSFTVSTRGVVTSPGTLLGLQRQTLTTTTVSGHSHTVDARWNAPPVAIGCAVTMYRKQPDKLEELDPWFGQSQVDYAELFPGGSGVAHRLTTSCLVYVAAGESMRFRMAASAPDVTGYWESPWTVESGGALEILKLSNATGTPSGGIVLPSG